MILIPYRAQIKLHKLPVVTILISLLCLAVFTAQIRNLAVIEKRAEAFCTGQVISQESAREQGRWRSPPAWARSQDACMSVMLGTYIAPDPEEALARRVEELTNQEGEARAARYRETYRQFADNTPGFLTAALWLPRPSWNPLRMLTSAVTHGGWEHVIFNLFFFFAFAATIELLIGPVLFLATIVFLSVGIASVDNIIAVWSADTRPTLGLSGVVMGMLALFVYFLPRAKIRFFFWFLIFFGTFGIPAWFVAVSFVGLDLFNSLRGAGGPTNFVAHLAGAALGLGLGITLFRRKRHWAQELVVEEVDFTKQESVLTKFSAILTSFLILPVIFITALIVISLVVWFIQSFWLQLLLLAPVGAAGWQVYRLRRAKRPDLQIFQEGMDAFNKQQYDTALKRLKPLAERGYPHALFALGNFYTIATGALRNDAQALRYYRRAAERGHPEAQYVLGAWYADGRGMQKDTAKAIVWYQKAATQGLGEAANSLGYLFENGAGVEADKKQATEWYYRAGVAFKKAGKKEDAQAMVNVLNNLAKDYPAVLQLVAKLKAIVA